MDAGDFPDPDNHFDKVFAMHLITVAPAPNKLLRELERVTKPGGTVIFVNHFSANTGCRSMLEQRLKCFGHRSAKSICRSSARKPFRPSSFSR
ncbi:MULTISPECIES: class I SAM-dependent methyltransferase [Stappiaceae]|uniref:class I SAM-dependent methyltransferase n=1 Tax=Stappiaceae TaxID=2821832 RepID=UPI0009DF664A|nr:MULTISPECIES: methyltransferase domain-containing protein [Stappiaceae]WJS05656.1 methyltransferase domain-containing protein [Roseibium aggregatum]